MLYIFADICDRFQSCMPWLKSIGNLLLQTLKTLFVAIITLSHINASYYKHHIYLCFHIAEKGLYYYETKNLFSKLTLSKFIRSSDFPLEQLVLRKSVNKILATLKQLLSLSHSLSLSLSLSKAQQSYPLRSQIPANALFRSNSRETMMVISSYSRFIQRNQIKTSCAANSVPLR